MAVLTTFTSTTDVEEVIPTELLGDFVQGFEYVTQVNMGIAWQSAGRGSIVKRYPRFQEVTVPAGTKTESDQFTDTEIATTESSITPGLVGFRFPIPDEVMEEAEPGVPAGILMEAMTALGNRIDSDLVAEAANLTNSVGLVTDTYDLARFKADLSAYRALHIPVAPLGSALVLHENGSSDLTDALSSTASIFAKESGDTLQVGPTQGFIGNLHGVAIYTSDNAPVNGAGHDGYMTPIGGGASAIGLVVNELPRMEMTRGDDATNRAVTYFHFRSWYGAGVTNPNRGLRVLHQ